MPPRAYSRISTSKNSRLIMGPKFLDLEWWKMPPSKFKCNKFQLCFFM